MKSRFKPPSGGAHYQSNISTAAWAHVFAEHKTVISRQVRAAARKYPWVDTDDLEQVAEIALWEAYRAYNPARGPFQNYAAATVRNTLLHAAMAERRQR